MKISFYSQGRDNNFNLIRIVAAISVLITHSFALVMGSGEAEPFRESLGMTMGSIAVDVFFITSGFLVTSSLMGRKSIVEFAWARVLRVFPALLVMLLLTVFVLGVYFSELPALQYLSSAKTYVYLVKCATLILGAAYELPGVFADNPYKIAVNGSLWTMPHEVRMYAILAIIWVALRRSNKNRLNVFRAAVVGVAFFAGAYAIFDHLYLHFEGYFSRLLFMFFLGSVYCVLRERIILVRWLFWIFVFLLLLSTLSKQVFFFVYIFTVPYILFYFAYIPAGSLRKYNRLGDYSYGVYIYAFPVQQSIAALLPGISVPQMIVFSAAITMVFSILSWHLVEKRSLDFKEHCVGYTRRILKI